MTCSRVEGPIARRFRDFCGLPRDSLTSRTSSRKKHLDKFFKIFVLSVLVTSLGDLLMTWLNRENRMFFANRSVFKHFQFFPRTSMTVHYLPYLKLSQTHRVTLEQTSIFTSFQLKIFKKKVWVFSFSLHSSCSESYLLESVSCWFDLGYLLCLDFWVLLIRLLGFYFCFHGWYWLCVSIDPFSVWISYPLCYDLFWYTVMHFVCIFG